MLQLVSKMCGGHFGYVKFVFWSDEVEISIWPIEIYQNLCFWDYHLNLYLSCWKMFFICSPKRYFHINLYQLAKIFKFNHRVIGGWGWKTFSSSAVKSFITSSQWCFLVVITFGYIENSFWFNKFDSYRIIMLVFEFKPSKNLCLRILFCKRWWRHLFISGTFGPVIYWKNRNAMKVSPCWGHLCLGYTVEIIIL